jgi:tripartite-type tricarboxylate transporter receptor subunit TctC
MRPVQYFPQEPALNFLGHGSHLGSLMFLHTEGEEAGMKSTKSCRASEVLVFTTLVFVCCTPAAFSQYSAASVERYPNHAIQMIVPWAPSGPTDVFARLVASHLQSVWGQPVIVDNRAGGSGTIGAVLVARAPADGYTLLFNSVTNVIAPLLQKIPAYNPVDSFEPVAMTARIPQLILINSAVPARTLPALIAYAKGHPGQLNYSSSGVGSINHLVMELFKDRAQIDVAHVPYKGGAPALTALVANEVQLTVSDVMTTRAHIEAGRIRALAQVEAVRSPLLPGVPTITEAAGLADFGLTYWNGIFAPKGTPTPIIAKLNQEVNRAMESSGVAEKAATFGSEVVRNTPEAFRARVQRDAAIYRNLIQRNHIAEE